jgi:hypothetical protein
MEYIEFFYIIPILAASSDGEPPKQVTYSRIT